MSDNNNYNEYLEIKRNLFDLRYGFLNKEQRKAVYTNEGPLLILAGAGSGKTTVLVNRIAFMIKYGNAYFKDNLEKDLDKNINDSELNSFKNMLSYAKDLVAHKNIEKIDELLEQFAFNQKKCEEILAITFTNKAANEMKERLNNLLGEDAKKINMGTFHKICVKILRKYINKLEGYNNNFTIFDEDDCKKVAGLVLKELNIDSEKFKAKNALKAVSDFKTKLNYPEDLENPKDMATLLENLKTLEGTNFSPEFAQLKLKNVLSFYKLYDKKLRENNALDFDDIICFACKILSNKENKEILDYYNNKFKYILVDEYQDSNFAQFVLVKLLAQKYSNIMVVGDDDQSIYKFRGATIENILRFEKQYKNAKVIKLEQNYRSTEMILNSANKVIANNSKRMGKNLFTKQAVGEKITVKETQDQNYEANYVVEEIKNLVAQGKYNYKDFAVLFRLNQQSATLEMAFTKANLPHRLLNGVRFYDRKEIKDIIAYLQLIANPADNIRLRRVINEPKRGIGTTTIDFIDSLAQQYNKSMYEIIKSAENYEDLSKSQSKLEKFVEMIDKLRNIYNSNYNYSDNDGERMRLSEFVETVFTESGYKTMLEDSEKSKNDKREKLERMGHFTSGRFGHFEEKPERQEKASSDEKDSDRLKNVEELIAQIELYQRRKEGYDEEFEFENEEIETGNENEISLNGFLEEVALVSDVDKYDENADAVSLMTIHTSKGLEFTTVFLVGMEENLFPMVSPQQKLKESLMFSLEGQKELLVLDNAANSEIEEERRLAYVAITRAKNKLYITHAKERIMYGRSGYNSVSRFVEKELPKDLCEFIKLGADEKRYKGSSDFTVKRSKYPPKLSPKSEFATEYKTSSSVNCSNKVNMEDLSQSKVVFKAGDEIAHEQFGKGIIIKAQPMGGDVYYEVDFEKPEVGVKRMMGNMQKFEKVEKVDK